MTEYNAKADGEGSYFAAIEARREKALAAIKREVVIGDCRLLLGDCLEILPAIGAVHAVVTDPPYGVGFKYASHDDTSDGYQNWCAAWFSLLRDKSVGPVAVSCGISNVTDWPKPTWILCWHKPASMGRCVVGFNNWEPVLVYGKTRAGQVVDVFRAPIITSEEVSGHPCPKPIAWGEGIVSRVSAEADTILDPFMGSGTTGVACVKLGRKFIGIEIDPGYFDIACERIRKAYAQPDFFVEASRSPEPVQEGLPW